jgi:hypothetical protein
MQGLRTAIVATCVATFLVAGCGSPTDFSSSATPVSSASVPGSKIIEMSAVVAAMTKADTARWEGSFGRASTSHTSGELDLAHRYMSARSTDAGTAFDLAILQRPTRSYLRGPTGTWCWTKTPTISLADPSIFATLDTLGRSGARPEYVGTDTVRGVATRHFQLRGTKTFDLWVDGQDRMRRLAGQSPLGPFSEEFFDFGAKVTFVEPNADTAPCEQG